MGGSYHKGNSNTNGGGHSHRDHSHRGKPYGLMLLLAFGAALLGVMVLHKLRERRIFYLLVHEKDQELISFQLLLQKEKDYSKEMRRKNEEMKAKIYSLRNQKMELDRRILEKQSTIDLLKDEKRTLESALEEKQNEFKMLREKEIDPGKENPQLITLMESLKQKEAEIEDLKHRLEYPVKVWSVSTDDPSSPPVNLTVNGSVTGQDQSEVIMSNKEGEQLQESSNYMRNENSTSEDGNKLKSNNFREAGSIARVEEGTENKAEDTTRREMMREQMQKLKNLKDGLKNGSYVIEKPSEEVQGNKNEDSHNGGDFGSGKREDEMKVMGKLENSQEHDHRELDEIHKDERKLEEPENSSIGRISRMRAKHGHASKTKGKKWRMLVKNRWLENNGNSINDKAVRMKTRKFFIGDQDGLKGRTTENKDKMEREGGEMGVNDPMEVRKAADSSDGKDLNSNLVYADTNHQVVNGQEMLENPHNFPKEVQLLKNGTANGDVSNIILDDRKQKLDKVRESSEEHEASGIQQDTSSGNINEVEKDTEQTSIDETTEVPEDLEDGNVKESEKGEDSLEDVEEEEYKDDTDES
ncbi:hypothetical protein SO802_015640 [Lithocarpus litseifolius]|uniref:Uncharacterized protein n=1 Tax=Lithocarpus litseifolius TaxID=425828 RepID=A0AAW2CUV9_9ROSI